VALLQLLILFAIVWIALTVVWLVRQRRRLAEEGRWQARTRALEGGGHVVELVRPGEPSQEVQRIRGDLGWEQLGEELAEAMSEAEARASTLNATAAPPSGRRRRRR
jgi:hypothetical protein